MARIDDLIGLVNDDQLKSAFEESLADLRRRKRFGLVFEEHIPETAMLATDVGLHVGSEVVLRREPPSSKRYVVERITEKTVLITDGTKSRRVKPSELMTVVPFGEPVYPVLRQAGESVMRDGDKPFHTVINGENFHALQLMLFSYEGKVDCIYLDPPYNTGARDWKYNNDYVDDNDTYRHSKWLSFMEKRLRLAKRLLKADGVLIVTINENELFNLGVLLRQIFREYQVNPVSIVINARGSTGDSNFGVIDEYALFVVPEASSEVISPREKYIPQLGSMATETGASELVDDDDGEPEGTYWRTAYRQGQQTSFRHQRKNQFYPIYLDAKTKELVGVGEPLLPKSPGGLLPKMPRRNPKGKIAVWPIDTEGKERTWAFESGRMRREIANGNIRVGGFNKTRGQWTLSVRRVKQGGHARFRERTVWWEKSYDAGQNGTALLTKLLGESGRFPFPKSVYAVRDTLATVVGSRPGALVLDFFAGSGTTLHAVALLNAIDDGRRRCIIVTDNEVDEAKAAELHDEGLYRGDTGFEAHGIAKPQSTEALTACGCWNDESGTPRTGKIDLSKE